MNQVVERALAVNPPLALYVTGVIISGDVEVDTISLFAETPFGREPFPVQPDSNTKIALAYFLSTGDLDGALRLGGYKP